MASRKSQGRRTFRDLVYSLFANRRVLGIFILLGALLGFLRAATQERAYFGRVELACAGHAHPASGALPDAVQLRRIVLDPKNLQALIGTEKLGKSAAPPPKLPVVALRPVLEDTSTEAAVWQVQVDVPAENRQAAIERLNAFIERLQSTFSKSLGMGEKRGEPEGKPADPVAFAAAKAPQNEAPAEPAPDAAKAAAPAADGPPTPTVGRLESEIALLEGRIARGEVEQADIARAIAERRRLTAELTDNPRAEWLPVALEADFPDVAALGRRRDALVERRTALAAVVTGSHPALRALDRSFAAVRARLTDGLAEVQRVYGRQVEALVAQSRQLEASILADRRQLAQLADTMAKAMAGESSERRDRDERILGFLTRSVSPAPDQPGGPILAPPLPPGKLLVAGPFVDSSPVRPRQVRDAALGAALGLALGLTWIVVRSSLDQRVHVAADVDDLALDLEVFGSIPQLKSAAPVRLAGEST